MLYESYYGIVPLGPSLKHHGIKGQKWGIRRFQKEDGSLTSAGKQRYGRRSDGKDYYIKRGTKMQRLTDTKNEPTTDERKYVTYLKEDSKRYDNIWYKRYGMYKMRYKSVKDLKVAGAETYFNNFMKLYGDKKIRDFAEWNEGVDKAKEQFDMWLRVRPDKNEYGKTVNAPFLKQLKDAGYDAVEDQFSRSIDGTTGPLVILNPKDSMRLTKKNSKWRFKKYESPYIRNRKR